MRPSADNQSSKIALPKLSLPSGGGRTGASPTAYTVSENLGSGTLPFRFELPVARDLTLDLAITYSSGGANGLFGAGFEIDIPSFLKED